MIDARARFLGCSVFSRSDPFVTGAFAIEVVDVAGWVGVSAADAAVILRDEIPT